MTSRLLFLAEVLGIELVWVRVMCGVHVDAADGICDEVILLQAYAGPWQSVVFCAVSSVEPDRSVEPQGLMDQHVDVGEILDCLVVWHLSIVVFKRLVHLLMKALLQFLRTCNF